MRLLAIIAALTLILDQFSKYLVVHLMNLAQLGEITTLAPYLNLRMAWNSGVNFGLFAHSSDATRWVLIALALGISAAVLFWLRKDQTNARLMAAAGLLVGGALGNVIDRVIYGAVADFLNMSCCGIQNPYSFNVADVAIFAGAVGLAVFTDKKAETDRKTP